MIKSIVSGLVALSVVAMPVAAEARGRHDGNRYEQRHHRSRISTGEAIAIGMGAFILGAAVSGGNRRDERVYDRDYDRGYDRGYDYEYRRPVCREVISSGYDRYGYYYEKRTVRC